MPHRDLGSRPRLNNELLRAAFSWLLGAEKFSAMAFGARIAKQGGHASG